MTMFFARTGTKCLSTWPLDGSVKSDGFAATAKSSLAQDGKVRMAIEKRQVATRSTVRKPEWAEGVVLTRNGKAVAGLKIADVAAGDEIVAQYTMRFRAESADRVQSLPGRTMMHFGPWLLGATSHDQPEYFNEIYAQNEIVAGSNHAARVQAHRSFRGSDCGDDVQLHCCGVSGAGDEGGAAGGGGADGIPAGALADGVPGASVDGNQREAAGIR